MATPNHFLESPFGVVYWRSRLALRNLISTFDTFTNVGCINRDGKSNRYLFHVIYFSSCNGTNILRKMINRSGLASRDRAVPLNGFLGFLKSLLHVSLVRSSSLNGKEGHVGLLLGMPIFGET